MATTPKPDGLLAQPVTRPDGLPVQPMPRAGSGVVGSLIAIFTLGDRIIGYLGEPK